MFEIGGDRSLFMKSGAHFPRKRLPFFRRWNNIVRGYSAARFNRFGVTRLHRFSHLHSMPVPLSRGVVKTVPVFFIFVIELDRAAFVVDFEFGLKKCRCWAPSLAVPESEATRSGRGALGAGWDGTGWRDVLKVWETAGSTWLKANPIHLKMESSSLYPYINKNSVLGIRNKKHMQFNPFTKLLVFFENLYLPGLITDMKSQMSLQYCRCQLDVWCLDFELDWNFLCILLAHVPLMRNCLITYESEILQKREYNISYLNVSPEINVSGSVFWTFVGTKFTHSTKNNSFCRGKTLEGYGEKVRKISGKISQRSGI